MRRLLVAAALVLVPVLASCGSGTNAVSITWGLLPQGRPWRRLVVAIPPGAS